MKKRSILVTFIILIFILLCVFVSGKFLHKDKQLTFSEKNEDAKFLINFIEENYPFLEIKESLTGYDFLEHKEELIKRISNSKNESEFYLNVYKTIKLLQNSHTRIANMKEVNDYILGTNFNSVGTEYPFISSYSNTIDESTSASSQNWDDVFVNMYYIPDITCSYVDGKYIVTKSLNEDINLGDEILQVKGKSVEEYLNENIDIYTLYYDFEKEKLFTNKLFVFPNLKKVKSIPVTILSKDNTEKLSKVHMEKFNLDTYNKLKESKEDNISTRIIEKDNIAYLKINSMNDENNGIEKIKNFFININGYKNLIIDIRGNGGGGSGGGGSIPDTIISHISKQPLTVTDYLYFRQSEYTETFIEKAFKSTKSKISTSASLPGDNMNGKYIAVENSVEYSFSKENNFDGKVFLLVDYEVYSYSEFFANHVKRLNLATIIGTNTGGDGITVTPHINMLPNSKLSFKMSLALGVDDKGNINEKEHTAPDYYVEQGIEDSKRALENGITDIENTEYDTILNKCISIINGK
ncbi:MAG: S41 family peptidase [Clostridium sp.]|uniref:S41 family peptidase n=1 Tax=Clostridium sp. TaxID=1506 RepID=UPI0032162630